MLTVIYVSHCKNYLVEVAGDEVENQRDYVDEGFTIQTNTLKEKNRNEQKEGTTGPKIPREEIETLKQSMENIFGKNWSLSDVQGAFDESGDFDDGDLVDSDLFVCFEGNDRLIPMGNIKVKYVSLFNLQCNQLHSQR